MKSDVCQRPSWDGRGHRCLLPVRPEPAATEAQPVHSGGASPTPILALSAVHLAQLSPWEACTQSFGFHRISPGPSQSQAHPGQQIDFPKTLADRPKVITNYRNSLFFS